MQDDPNVVGKKADASLDDRTGSGAGEIREPTVHIEVPGKPDVTVRMSGVPDALLQVVENLKKPKSIWTKILKDYIPVLTPLAAVFISLAAFYYTNKFNERTAASASAETLGKLVSEVAQKTDDQTKTVEAMKLAVYGEQALPAVKIVLGADDADLRDGGVRVAKQMYLAETVDRGRLTSEMLKYYDNASLRLGVLEWFADVESEIPRPLSEKEGKAVFCKLKASFGSQGERCTEQGEDMALAASQFLSAWSAGVSGDFVRGMKAHCSKDFVGVHKELQKIPEFK